MLSDGRGEEGVVAWIEGLSLLKACEEGLEASLDLPVLLGVSGYHLGIGSRVLFFDIVFKISVKCGIVLIHRILTKHNGTIL